MSAQPIPSNLPACTHNHKSAKAIERCYRERVAASRKLPPVEHIRREDECEITYCGLLTAICADPSDTAPIAVGPAGGGVAIYADQEHLAGYRRCGTCDDNYFAV